MCDKPVDNLSPITTRFKYCVIKLLILILLLSNLLSNVIRLKKCDKAVYTCPFVFDSVPDQHKTQEMCHKGALSGPRQVLATGSHLNMIKNAFCLP